MRSSIILGSDKDILLIDPEVRESVESIYGRGVLHAHYLYLNRNYDPHYNQFIALLDSLDKQMRESSNISSHLPLAYKIDDMLTGVRSHYVDLSMGLIVMECVYDRSQAYSETLFAIKSGLVSELERIEDSIAKYFFLRLNVMTEELLLSDLSLSPDQATPLRWLTAFAQEVLYPEQKNYTEYAFYFIFNILKKYCEAQGEKLRENFQKNVLSKALKDKANKSLQAEKVIIEYFAEIDKRFNTLNKTDTRHKASLDLMEQTLFLNESYNRRMKLVQ